MSNPNDPPPELVDCINGLCSVLESRALLLHLLIAAVTKNPNAQHLRADTADTTDVPEKVAHILPLMLYSLGSSSATLRKLAGAPWVQTRDSFSIARALFELGVNICYIISQGDDAAELAMRHTRQKAFRDLDRESEIGDSYIKIMYDGKPDPSTIDGLVEDLDAFTARNGSEKRDWVNLNVDQRIAAVGEKLGPDVMSDLHYARFMVFRHSSEILHGTHFGVRYCFGLTTPGVQTQADALANMGDQQMMILMAANVTLSAVALAFHKAYGHSEAENYTRAFWDKTGEVFRNTLGKK